MLYHSSLSMIKSFMSEPRLSFLVKTTGHWFWKCTLNLVSDTRLSSMCVRTQIMKWYLTILMTVFAFNKLSVVPRLRSNWWNCGGERMSALEFKQRLSHMQRCEAWTWQEEQCEAHGECDTCIHGISVIYNESNWALTRLQIWQCLCSQVYQRLWMHLAVFRLSICFTVWI